MMILSLAACSSTPVAPPAKIITETEYVTPSAPIVPLPDPLTLKEIEFVIVTPENVDEIFKNLKEDKVLFAVTAKGYENLSLNLSDVRAYIMQQKSIIILYESVWEE
jgi:hypothetical protein